MIRLEGALFKRWKLEGNEGSQARSKENGFGNALPWMIEGSKAHSKEDERSKAHSKGNEGSKAHSKEVRAQRRTQKKAGLGNALPWMVKGSKAHSKEVKVRRRTQKEVEKYIEFSGGPILVGGLPRSKISQKWKKFKSIFNFGPFWGGLPYDGSYWGSLLKNLQNALFNVSELYDVHAFLPDLKYRPPHFFSIFSLLHWWGLAIWFESSLSLDF